MSVADFLIYVHPELPAQERAALEVTLAGSVGVVSASFDKHEHPHAIIVEYNPDAVHSRQILDIVRQHDPAATMAGL